MVTKDNVIAQDNVIDPAGRELPIMKRRKVMAAAVSVLDSKVHSCHSHSIATDQQPAP